MPPIRGSLIKETSTTSKMKLYSRGKRLFRLENPPTCAAQLTLCRAWIPPASESSRTVPNLSTLSRGQRQTLISCRRSAGLLVSSFPRKTHAWHAAIAS